MSFRSRQSRLLIVAGACLIAVLVAAWQLAGLDSQSTRSSESRPTAPRDPVVAAGDLREPEASGATTTVTAPGKPTRESLALEHTGASEDRITIPGFDARVEGLPGVPSGRCELRVQYRADSSLESTEEPLDEGVATVLVPEDGTLRVPPRLHADSESIDRVEFRYEAAGLRISMEEVGTGRVSFPLSEGGGWILRPREELFGVCCVDEAGEVLWDEPLSVGGSPGWVSRRGTGWLSQRLSMHAGLETLRLQVRGKTRLLPADVYPVGVDGLLRVPLAELGRWDRELVIESEQPLPDALRLRFEREWRGEYRVYDAGSKRSDVLPGVYPERTQTGWVCRHIPPGKYRVTMFLGERRQDGEWLIGEADLRVATRAVLSVPPFEFRSLVVKVLLPEDFDERGMRPLRVRVDGPRSDARWIPCNADHARFDWLGPKPTHARISGKRGPMLHTELPLSWRDHGVAVLDASALELRRCKIDPPEDGTPLIAQEMTRIKIGGPPASVERVWTTLPADDALWELCWWEGASFEVPLLERDAEGWRPSEETALFDSLSPEAIGRSERFVPRRLAGYSRSVRLVGGDRGWVPVYAWLGAAPPTAAQCDASLEELKSSGSWLSLGLRNTRDAAEISVPSRAGGLLLIDQRAVKRAYVPRGVWNDELSLDRLDWH